MSVPSRRVDSYDELTATTGAFILKGERLTFNCPCGCGDIAGIRIKVGEKDTGYWQWDGNTEQPTLTPSILRMDGCKWHGFLRAGEWVNA